MLFKFAITPDQKTVANFLNHKQMNQEEMRKVESFPFLMTVLKSLITDHPEESSFFFNVFESIFRHNTENLSRKFSDLEKENQNLRLQVLKLESAVKDKKYEEEIYSKRVFIENDYIQRTDCKDLIYKYLNHFKSENGL